MMNAIEDNRFILPIILRCLCLAGLCGVLVGCGGSGAISQADLMKYGINRGGDDDDASDDNPAPVAKTATASDASTNAGESEAVVASDRSEPSNSSSRPAAPTVATTAGTPTDKASPQAAVAEVAAGEASDPEAVVVKGLIPIADRKPANPLSELERRQRSIANMQKINAAVVQWIEQTGAVPTSAIKNSVGQPGLSWRVQILPLLGYETLYRKFNLKEPWDGPTNKPLLEFIPEEFASPERFDTFTNYQLIVNGPALFSDRRRLAKSEISDGDKILIMVETDDALAVPWTSPFDYDYSQSSTEVGLGGLRQDGAFVGWLNGVPSLWPRPITRGALKPAITFEAGDRFDARRVMKFPPSAPGGSGRPGLGAAAGVANAQPSIGGNSSLAGDSQGLPAAGPKLAGDFQRMPMPSQEAILAAEATMRSTYLDAFNAARTPMEYAKLAKTIYTQITKGAARPSSVRDDEDAGSIQPLSMPPAELFVGLRTALNVSVRGADPKLALDLLEQLDARFEVDRSNFEATLLDGFLGSKGSLRTDLNKASAIVPMMEQMVERNVENDDFRTAEKILETGMPVVRALNNRETYYRWQVLDDRVSQGKRLFPKVAKQIEILEAKPSDPDANFSVGWYFCMVKNNWNAGASMLAKSEDTALRALGLLEIQNDNDLRRHLALGDGWWDYAVRQEEEPFVYEAAMKRSRHWYTSASLGLSDGLDRIRANNRLKQIDQLIGRDPDQGSRTALNR